MQYLDNSAPVSDLSAAWCNECVMTTSVMEAVSFVTPVLEGFFVNTVCDALARPLPAQLEERAQAFIAEESAHSRAHNRLNAVLFEGLGKMPPGLVLVQSLLNAARKYLSFTKRLLLVAAFEHVAAVLSSVYLKRAADWTIACTFARELFTGHAHEELAHCTVAFDLCVHEGAAGRGGRILAAMAVLLAGMVYVAIAVPWILHRKSGRRLTRTLSLLARATLSYSALAAAGGPVREFFAFTRGDFHPQAVTEVRSAGSVIR